MTVRSGRGKPTTPWEERANTQSLLRLALRFARLMLNHNRVGLTVAELAEELEVSNRHAHRLVRAACLAGWPLGADDEFRWKLAR